MTPTPIYNTDCILGAIQATASTKTVDIDAAGNIALAAVTSDAALTIDATNSHVRRDYV